MTGNEKLTADDVVRKMYPQWLVDDLVGAPQEPQFADELNDLGKTAVLGLIWPREGLDLRVRSLVTVAMLIAMRARNQLAIHIPGAIRNGATLTEIEELIYHSAGYVGYPAAMEARDVGRESLKEQGMI